MTNFHEALQKYSQVHFQDEESLMKELGYPFYDRHRKEHQYFQTRIEGIRAVLKKDDGASLMAIRFSLPG